MHVLGICGEFVKDIAAPLQQLVVGISLGQLRDSLGIAGLGLDIFAALEIEISEGELSQRLVNAVAGGFLYRELIIGDSLGRIAARQVEIADGVINLIQEFGIAGVPRHGLERPHFPLDIGTLEHLAALDAGVEFGAIVGGGTRSGLLECRIGFLFLAKLGVGLSQQEPQTVLLRA